MSPALSKAKQNMSPLILRILSREIPMPMLEASTKPAAGSGLAGTGVSVDLEAEGAIRELTKGSTVSTLVNLPIGVPGDVEGAIDGKMKKGLEGERLKSPWQGGRTLPGSLVADSLFAKRAPVGMGTIASILEELAAGEEDAEIQSVQRGNFADKRKNEVQGDQ